jgi:hypothetical protein
VEPHPVTLPGVCQLRPRSHSIAVHWSQWAARAIARKTAAVLAPWTSVISHSEGDSEKLLIASLVEKDPWTSVISRRRPLHPPPIRCSPRTGLQRTPSSVSTCPSCSRNLPFALHQFNWGLGRLIAGRAAPAGIRSQSERRRGQP